MIELVSESVRPLERAFDLQKFMRIELADDSALFFTQKPSNICSGRFYPAVDMCANATLSDGVLVSSMIESMSLRAASASSVTSPSLVR